MPFPESVEREIVQTLGQLAIVQLLADLYTPAEIDVWLASPQPGRTLCSKAINPKECTYT
jgi:hypothetical protein